MLYDRNNPDVLQKVKASDYIVAFLEAHGIEYVFGYQGGMIAHIVDSLSKSKKTKFVQCYHEQSAGFAAEGYARATGKFGVCITTSGPGATNVVTSMGNAYFDSVPVLYITGQVNSFEYKYDSPIRQRGFQETDIVSIAKPILKSAVLCDDPARLPEELSKAVAVMCSGRKGPALIDLPMDVQRADIAMAEAPQNADRRTFPHVPDFGNLDAAIRTLEGAERPIAICGGGLASPEINAMARVFLLRTGIPYVVSLMGKGLVPEDSDRFVGMIGSYGNRAANYVLSKADVALCLGTRLDSRQTGNRERGGIASICFVRVDVDEDELNDHPFRSQINVLSDLGDFLSDSRIMDANISPGERWLSYVHGIAMGRSQAEDVERHAGNGVPYDVMRRISDNAARDALFVVDIGQNQMWAAQTIKCYGSRRFYTSGGMAPMGYAVPAAVGISMANPHAKVICICGDGGLHISSQALMLIGQYRLPVAVICFNNRALGMITQFQKLYFEGNMPGTVDEGGYRVPDLAMMASAYGLEYRKVGVPEDITESLLTGPCVIEVDTCGLTTVVPKMEYGNGLDNMSPAWPIDYGVE